MLIFKPKTTVLIAPSWAPGLALLLYVIGAGVLLAAWIVLRPSLRISPIPKEGAALITSGIYHFIRHPMYIGVLLFGAGFVLTNINWISIAMWVALLATLVYKARFEDSLLAIKHPHAAVYQSSTARFFLKGGKDA